MSEDNPPFTKILKTSSRAKMQDKINKCHERGFELVGHVEYQYMKAYRSGKDKDRFVATMTRRRG